MPVKRKLMSNLKREYGKKQAKNVYYAMENKAKLGDKRLKKIFN